jgi:hypothetical protein
MTLPLQLPADWKTFGLAPEEEKPAINWKKGLEWIRDGRFHSKGRIPLPHERRLR